MAGHDQFCELTDAVLSRDCHCRCRGREDVCAASHAVIATPPAPDAVDVCGESETTRSLNMAPTRTGGCGQPIHGRASLYRCADCSVPFHQSCLQRHFGKHAPAPDAVVEAAIFLESLAASTQTGYAYASAAECREHAVALRALAASRAPGRGDEEGGGPVSEREDEYCGGDYCQRPDLVAARAQDAERIRERDARIVSQDSELNVAARHAVFQADMIKRQAARLAALEREQEALKGALQHLVDWHLLDMADYNAQYPSDDVYEILARAHDALTASRAPGGTTQ